jgi:hypothetical protein
MLAAFEQWESEALGERVAGSRGDRRVIFPCCQEIRNGECVPLQAADGLCLRRQFRGDALRQFAHPAGECGETPFRLRGD